MARVLEIGELTLAKGKSCWLEQRDDPITPLVKVNVASVDVMKTKSDERRFGYVAFDFWPVTTLVGAYFRGQKSWNKSWRCWDEEPTVYERDAVKWDG